MAKVEIERLYRIDFNEEFALRAYEKLGGQSKHPMVLVRLGGLYFERGDKERAVKTLNIAKSLNYWEAYSNLAYIYIAEGKEREAIEAAEMALKLNPSDAQSYNNLAWIYATLLDKEFYNSEKSKHLALTAIELTREQNAEYLDMLTEAYFVSGEKEQSIKTIELVIDRLAKIHSRDEKRIQGFKESLYKFQASDGQR